MSKRKQELQRALMGNVSLESSQDDELLDQTPEELEEETTEVSDEETPVETETSEDLDNSEVDPEAEEEVPAEEVAEEEAPEEDVTEEEASEEGEDLFGEAPEDTDLDAPADDVDTEVADEAPLDEEAQEEESVDEEGEDLFAEDVEEEAPESVEGEEPEAVEEESPEESVDEEEAAEEETPVDESGDDLFGEEGADSEEPVEVEGGDDLAADAPADDIEVPEVETDEAGDNVPPTPEFDDPTTVDESVEETAEEEAFEEADDLFGGSESEVESDSTPAENIEDEEVPLAEEPVEGAEPEVGGESDLEVPADDQLAPSEVVEEESSAPIDADDLFGREEEAAPEDQAAEQVEEVAEVIQGEAEGAPVESGEEIDPAAVEGEEPETIVVDNSLDTPVDQGEDLFNEVADTIVEGEEVADQVQAENAAVVEANSGHAADAENELGAPESPASEMPEDGPTDLISAAEEAEEAPAEVAVEQELEFEEEVQEGADLDQTQDIVTREVVSTEALTSALEVSLEHHGGLSATGAALLKVASSSGMGRFIPSEGLVLSTESYGGTMSRRDATELSLESLKERGRKIFDTLIEIMRKAIAQGEKILAFIFHEAPRMEVSLKRLLQEANQLDSGARGEVDAVLKGSRLSSITIDGKMPAPKELIDGVDKAVALYAQVFSQANAANYSKLIDLASRINIVEGDKAPSDEDVNFFGNAISPPTINAKVKLETNEKLLAVLPVAREEGVQVYGTEIIPGEGRFAIVKNSNNVAGLLVHFIKGEQVELTNGNVKLASAGEVVELCEAALPLVKTIKNFEATYRKRLKVQKAFISSVEREQKAAKESSEGRKAAVAAVSQIADAYRIQNTLDREASKHALNMIRGVLVYGKQSLQHANANSQDKANAEA